MDKINASWEKDGYLLRPARAEDAEPYYEQNYIPLDPEAARLTGSKPVFTHDEVVGFFRRCLDDPGRYDFLLLSPEGRIIGESVINEIDWEARSANFRIALFGASARDRGLGSWATALTRDYAFRDLGLHRLELDVFSINPRAERVYAKAGFVREGVRRDAIPLGDGTYCDDVLMAILEQDWRRGAHA